jgi:predicted nucleic acid-binding protein
MELVVDANILFAGLIKKSTTASLLFHPTLTLYAPEFVIEEFMKYTEFIQKKMQRSEEEFIMLIHMLHQIIAVVPQEEYENYMEEAKNISPDDKDTMYFALALKLNCSVWSNDTRLKEQDKITIYTTKELLTLVSK